MQRSFLKLGALSAAVCVALGAFGAHALKQLIPEKGLAIFETGVRYQFYHSIALLLAGILYKEFINKYLIWSGYLFCWGIVFFSGSLYLLSLPDVANHPALKWIGAVTPLGGVCFIAGWLLLAMGVSKRN